MALPVVGHQDAAEIGMAFEANSEEIEDFALVIIGANIAGPANACIGFAFLFSSGWPAT